MNLNNSNSDMQNKIMSIPELVLNADENLIFKLYAFYNAFIFVLVASNSVLDITSIVLKRTDVSEIENKLAESYKKLTQNLEKQDIKPEDYYQSLLFIDLISSTETYFVELIKIILVNFPKKLENIKFGLNEILDCASNNELVERAAEEYIYKLMYKKPNDFLAEICSTLSIDKSFLQQYWPSYIEAKARRDLGVHNNWRCNLTYLRKVSEVGIEAHNSKGDLMLPNDLEYANQVSDNILSMVESISSAIRTKYS